MANFKTHLTFSTLVGAGAGATAYLGFGVPLPTCILAGGLCSVSGMLPDIDSHSGVPLRESLAFGAAVVPMMLVDRLQDLGLSTESIVLIGAATYLFIRFVFARILSRYTVHRGMFHSIPAAVIFGVLAYLLASGDTNIRLFKAGAVFTGYLSHLVLDEIYSIEWAKGQLRLKRSFGTALKIWSGKWWPNLTTFAKLAILSYIAFKEPGWMDQYQEHVQPRLEHTATQWIDRVIR
ncbi:MAG: metal-dependent hydrolase [Patescibacteria group bacterium]|nr:metal-dependent hydrolase [Patescibacteria group bacterium]